MGTGMTVRENGLKKGDDVPPALGLQEPLAHDSRGDSLASTSVSSSEAGTSDSGSGTEHYDARGDVILRIEVLSERDLKALLALLTLAQLVGIAMLITALWVKLRRPESFFLGRTQEAVNIAVGVLCLAVLAPFCVPHAYRCLMNVRLRRRWSLRRRRAVGLFYFEAAVQLANVGVWLAANGYVLAQRCAWFDATPAWLSCVSWTCWNCLFATATIRAHNTNLRPTHERADATVFDAPWTVHAPILALWCVGQAFILGIGYQFGTRTHWGNGPGAAHARPPGCEHEVYNCIFGHAHTALSVCAILVDFAFVFLFFFYLDRTYRQLRLHSYRDFQIANYNVRMLTRTHGTHMVCMLASFIAYYWVRAGECTSYIQTTLGLLPMHVVVTGVLASTAYSTMPVCPIHGNPILQVWLQEFTWTEAEKLAKLRARSSSLPAACLHREQLDRQPMFCFETAIKLYYYAHLSYRLEEVMGREEQKLEASAGAGKGKEEEITHVGYLARHSQVPRHINSKSREARGRPYNVPRNIPEEGEVHTAPSPRAWEVLSWMFSSGRRLARMQRRVDTGGAEAVGPVGGDGEAALPASAQGATSLAAGAAPLSNAPAPVTINMPHTFDQHASAGRGAEAAGAPAPTPAPACAAGSAPALAMHQGGSGGCAAAGAELLGASPFAATPDAAERGESHTADGPGTGDNRDREGDGIGGGGWVAGACRGAGKRARGWLALLGPTAALHFASDCDAGARLCGAQHSQGPQRRAAVDAAPTFTMEVALGLYDLEHMELFWERSHDTHALLAWGRSNIVVTFRGTASLKNVLSDLQAWQRPWPLPARGSYLTRTRSAVHSGFLRSFTAAGLNKRISDRVAEIVAAGRGRKFVVRLTGHSLGGALATLAALECAQALKALHANAHIACYTFGAPRTGNHAFAAEYSRHVFDSWSIINDQDAVARSAKFFLLYKRPGQRVLINASGDLLVRPSFVELSIQRTPGGSSVSQHLLISYRTALVAVCRAQLDRRKRLQGGVRGVLQLLEGAWTREVLASAASLSEHRLRRTLRWGHDHLRPTGRQPRLRPHMPSRYRRLDAVAAWKAVVAWEAAKIAPPPQPCATKLQISSGFGPSLWGLPDDAAANHGGGDMAPSHNLAGEPKRPEGQRQGTEGEELSAKAQISPFALTSIEAPTSPFLRESMAAARRTDPAPWPALPGAAQPSGRVLRLLSAGVSKLRGRSGGGSEPPRGGEGGGSLRPDGPNGSYPQTSDDALLARLASRMRRRPSRSLANLRDISIVGVGSGLDLSAGLGAPRSSLKHRSSTCPRDTPRFEEGSGAEAPGAENAVSAAHGEGFILKAPVRGPALSEDQPHAAVPEDPALCGTGPDSRTSPATRLVTAASPLTCAWLPSDTPRAAPGRRARFGSR